MEDEIPEDPLRQLSYRETIDDGEWLEAIRTLTRAEEDFKEEKSLRGCGPSGTTGGKKRKLQDSKPTASAKRVKKQYTGKEKVDYKAKKAGERKGKKEGAVPKAGRLNTGCGQKPTRALL